MSIKRIVAVVLAVIVIVGLVGQVRPVQATEHEHNPITICHATPPDTAAQGWHKITIDDDAVVKDGHDGHAQDIIPPFHYWDKHGQNWQYLFYPGKNWDAGHIAIYNNGCVPPPPPTTPPPPPTTPPPTEEQKVTICHVTGSESNPYVEITIAISALPAHLGHGDIYPVPANGCPQPTKPPTQPPTPPATETQPATETATPPATTQPPPTTPAPTQPPATQPPVEWHPGGISCDITGVKPANGWLQVVWVDGKGGKYVVETRLAQGGVVNVQFAADKNGTGPYEVGSVRFWVTVDRKCSQEAAAQPVPATGGSEFPPDDPTDFSGLILESVVVVLGGFAVFGFTFLRRNARRS